MSNHEHNHGEDCGCGKEHGHHHHHEGCECGKEHGHHHHHHEGCGCGCGGDHHVERPIPSGMDGLSEVETSFLSHLLGYKYMPVARFIVSSTKEPAFESIAMAPVFITDPKDSMSDVKNMGAIIGGLEEKGYITLDYDIPLNGYSYSEYHESDLYAHFKATVDEGKGSERFLGDTARMETGSMAPSDALLSFAP